MALLRGELDWVVMKCLEKRRERRYETANGLARDVQRYLADEAVEARPPSAGYRLGKFLEAQQGPGAGGELRAAGAGGRAGRHGVGPVPGGPGQAGRGEAAGDRRRAEDEGRGVGGRWPRRSALRAEQREEQAIEAVKRFRDAVAGNPELKNNPELESLRRTLLKQPLDFFKSLRDRLQADRDTRPESLHRLAAYASFS